MPEEDDVDKILIILHSLYANKLTCAHSMFQYFSNYRNCARQSTIKLFFFEILHPGWKSTHKQQTTLFLRTAGYDFSLRTKKANVPPHSLSNCMACVQNMVFP